MDLILASTSPYRRALLERLQLPFRCEAPETDETPLPGESPAALATRLALEKARSVAASFPGATVIGSDQVAELEGRVIGKPGHHAAALEQLLASSGKEVLFYTGVALVNAERNWAQFHVERFLTRFRALAEETLDRYLRREQPYDCAGSFKCEGLGIALFERLEGRDPTSLEGLPLIALTDLLMAAGVDVLGGH
jgi:septum formation protein